MFDVIGFLGLLGSIALLFYALFDAIKRKGNFKKILLAALIVFIIAIVAILNTSTAKNANKETKEDIKTEQTEKEEKKDKKERKKEDEKDLDEINKILEESLKQQQGYALGKLNDNYEPIEDGEMHLDRLYSILIEKITLDKDGQLSVYVNGDFVNASETEKNNTAENVQRLANGAINSSGQLSSDESVKYTREGRMASFYLGENAVGHSKILNHNEYKWY